MPEERRFDKVTFRRSFQPNDQYLLLGGIGRPHRHGHQDGNAIIQFDDEARTWLVDRGREEHIKGIARPTQHNMVTVSRPGVEDGTESPRDLAPFFSELRYRHDDPEIGITSTMSPQLNGTDWTRHIVWVKEKYFVVLDDVKALEPGPVTFRCRWRTIGETRLDGNRFISTQRPKPESKATDDRELSLVLIHCDRATHEVTNGLEPPSAWGKYPYADPTVRVLVETAKGKIKEGQRHVFLNVFGVTPAGEEAKLQAERTGKAAVRVVFDGEERNIGLDAKGVPQVR